MTDTVRADPLHDPTISPPVLRPRSHVMVAPVVDGASIVPTRTPWVTKYHQVSVFKGRYVTLAHCLNSGIS